MQIFPVEAELFREGWRKGELTDITKLTVLNAILRTHLTTYKRIFIPYVVYA